VRAAYGPRGAALARRRQASDELAITDDDVPSARVR
jgi:hypothetical protein